MPRSKAHGTEGHESGPPRGRPARRHGDPGNVDAAQDLISEAAHRGRPTGSSTEAGEHVLPRTNQESAAQAFVDNIAADPSSLVGRSAQEIADEFTAAGYPATVERSMKRGTSGNAVQVRVQGHPEITNIQVHPGGGRHTPDGSPYWKISTSTVGRIWVVPGDFHGAGQLSGSVVRYDE